MADRNGVHGGKKIKELKDSTIKKKVIMKAVLFFIYTIIILALAIATALEQSQGTAFALENIYHSWWFALLWALLATLAVAALLAKRRTMKLPLTMMHASLIAILLGAAVSWATSESGMMHIRQGETTGYYLRNDRQMDETPFKVRLDSFCIDYYRNTNEPRDFRSHISVEGKKATISMNNIYKHNGYRLYQASFDDDLKGTVLSIRYDPWGTPLTYAAYGLLACSILLWWLTTRKKHKASAACIAMFFVVYAITHYTYFNKHSGHLLPVLNTPILPIHVSLIITAYILLATCLLLSAAFLVKRKAGNSRKRNQITILVNHLLPNAMFLLMLGIFVGAIWANLSWGNYWSWDPKEVWALITMMVYAIPLHRHSLTWLRRDATYHAYMILAFLCVMMTYYGVDLLGGMHSY